MKYTNSYRAIENVFRYIGNSTIETLLKDIYPEAELDSYTLEKLQELRHNPDAFWDELGMNNRFRFVKAVMNQ